MADPFHDPTFCVLCRSRDPHHLDILAAPRPLKPCPRARKKGSGKRRRGEPNQGRTEHAPHDWWAGEYLPVGDLAEPAHCPGWKSGQVGRVEERALAELVTGVPAMSEDPAIVSAINDMRVRRG